MRPTVEGRDLEIPPTEEPDMGINESVAAPSILFPVIALIRQLPTEAFQFSFEFLTPVGF